MIKFRASVLASGFAVSAALMLSGCASAGATSDDLGEPSIDEYQNVTAELDYATGTVRTPVDDYRIDTPEVALKATRAIAVRADQCRAELGLQPTAGSRDEVAPEPREDRRYGQWSVALASQFGFDLPPEAFDASESEAQGQECDRSARESLIEVLAPIGEYNLDMRIRDQASALALAHETGRASAASWRACVEQRGITVENDPAFPSQSYREQGKQAEILAAVAQAECGVSTGAVQTLYDLQARYEAAFVDRQAAALQELSDKRDSLVAALDEVVAEG